MSSSGTIISGEKTRSISGGSYEIKKLSEDKIGKNAFKHVNNKVTIKCPEKVLSVYMEFLPKKGVPKKATFE